MKRHMAMRGQITITAVIFVLVTLYILNAVGPSLVTSISGAINASNGTDYYESTKGIGGLIYPLLFVVVLLGIFAFAQPRRAEGG